jgi:hypothetical protein
VSDHARLDVDRFERHDIAVRGRAEMLAIRVVADARELPSDIASAPAAGGRRPGRPTADLARSPA